MRRDKTPTVIFTKKAEEPTLKFHCKFHTGTQMVRLPDGSLRCPSCGNCEVATRTIMTVAKDTIAKT
jgi:hypothetical protein